ncbi:MAG: redoxin family protein, partial [Candidatus Dormiibacterota bacterium]
AGRRPSRSLIWFAALLGLAIVVIGAFAIGLVIQQQTAPTGTLVVVASARQASEIATTGLQVEDASGWQSLGASAKRSIPAAPSNVVLVQQDLPTGSYTGLRVGSHAFVAHFSVTANQVSSILVQILGGQPLSVYVGQDQINLGLQELAGKLQAMPAFGLVDEQGRPFANASIAGKTVILAAFHTTCHETCPIYTGLFLQLAKQLPANTVLVEATTDPWDDTPAQLQAYANAVGAHWTFVTGSLAAMGAFWSSFGVQLSAGDVHSSILAVVDQHGFVRATYQGVPDVTTLPTDLQARLDGAGMQEWHHGNGWGSAQVLDTLGNVRSFAQQSPGGGQVAPSFGAPSLRGGGRYSLAQYRGEPVVVNFFASYCVPCRTELPMLEQQTAQAHVRLLLVDERDDGGAARSLLSGLGVNAPAVADPNGTVGAQYGVANLPETFFVQPNGRLEGSTLGQLTASGLHNHLMALGGT